MRAPAYHAARRSHVNPCIGGGYSILPPNTLPCRALTSAAPREVWPAKFSNPARAKVLFWYCYTWPRHSCRASPRENSVFPTRVTAKSRTHPFRRQGRRAQSTAAIQLYASGSVLQALSTDKSWCVWKEATVPPSVHLESPHRPPSRGDLQTSRRACDQAESFTTKRITTARLSVVPPRSRVGVTMRQAVASESTRQGMVSRLPARQRGRWASCHVVRLASFLERFACDLR